MTPILKVMTEYCAVYVDDINLSDLASSDPPLYARKMWQLFRPAIALFTLPATMQRYLMGTREEPNLTPPEFADTLYTLSQTETEDFTISLGEEFAGYELCNGRVRRSGAQGQILYEPLSTEYDSSTGTITVKTVPGEELNAGTVLDFDFYKDGFFIHDLSFEIMNILGMCFQVIWQDRFNTDWLSMVSKVEDRSFFEQNRANKIRADTERMEMLMAKLAGEMRRYEANLYFSSYVPLQKQSLIK